MRRCRLFRAGHMVEVSPLILACVRERQRDGQPDVEAMLETEEWAALELAMLVVAGRSARRRAQW